MAYKNQILTMLSSNKQGFEGHIFDHDPASRYVKAINLLIEKMNPKRKNEFLDSYIELLLNTDIEIFKPRIIEVLYSKWLNFPSIFQDIKWINKKIGTQKLDNYFWELFIEYYQLDKSSKKEHVARLTILIHAIKFGMISKNQFSEYGIVIKTILKLNINIEDQLLLNKSTKSQNISYYKCLFFVVKLLIDRKVDGLTLAEIMNIHFYKSNNTLVLSKQTEDFYVVLNQNLPESYLMHLSRLDIKKVFFLYEYVPNLFKELKFDSTQEPNLKNVIYSLFQNFMVSRVFLEAFIKDRINEKELNWFLSEITGKNIVYEENLPFKMSRKAAHFFRCLEYDVDLSVTLSLVFAQMYTLTQNIQFSRAVAYNIRNLNQTEFWIDAMSNLCNKGLDSGDVLEVIDYINEVVFVEGRKIDFKNKKLETLYRDIEQWHHELNAKAFFQSHRVVRLPNAFVPNFELEYKDSMYKIIQLKKSDELYYEGKYLDHCVYSYKRYCLNKKSFIFSLRCVNENNLEKSLITIEVDDQKQIRQAKGKYNRAATQDEKFIIQKWAVENEFQIKIWK